MPDISNFKDAPGSHADRRPILLDGLPDQAGIAAALRKAFSSYARDDCERDFGELLRRLD